MRFTYYGVLLDILRIAQNQKMDKMTKNSNGKQIQIPRPVRATAIQCSQLKTILLRVKRIRESFYFQA